MPWNLVTERKSTPDVSVRQGRGRTRQSSLRMAVLYVLITWRCFPPAIPVHRWKAHFTLPPLKWQLATRMFYQVRARSLAFVIKWNPRLTHCQSHLRMLSLRNHIRLIRPGVAATKISKKRHEVSSTTIVSSCDQVSQIVSLPVFVRTVKKPINKLWKPNFYGTYVGSSLFKKRLILLA
jgi:hypothetical protein